ncbi:MAG: hypothetical protein RR606_00680 [Oscillospiraceae bacterium]
MKQYAKLILGSLLVLALLTAGCVQKETPDAPVKVLEFIFSQEGGTAVAPEEYSAALTPYCTEDGLAFLLQNRIGWTAKNLAAEEGCSLQPSNIEVKLDKKSTQTQTATFSLVVTLTPTEGEPQTVTQTGTLQLAPKDGALLVHSIWLENPQDLLEALD